MAYRGRVLLELSTKLVDKPEQKSDDIASDDLLVVEVRQHEETQKRSFTQQEISSTLFLRRTEVSQEKEVLPLCGFLLGHAPAGR